MKFVHAYPAMTPQEALAKGVWFVTQVHAASVKQVITLLMACAKNARLAIIARMAKTKSQQTPATSQTPVL